MKKAGLIEIDWPDFGGGKVPIKTSSDEYLCRVESTRKAMAEHGLSHLIIYGDREHFASVAWLCGYDPRFEETLLILKSTEDPLLLVGNEGEGYLDVSPLYRKGRLRTERYQTFSLLDQPRDKSRTIKAILADEKITKKSNVGCVGWKYFSNAESSDPAHAIDLPSYLTDTLRELAGMENVVNATDLFVHPEYGLRTVSSASDIAYFEFTNILASEGMKRVIFGLREGMIDYDVFKLYEFNGEPLGCHPIFMTAQNRSYSLSSPVGAAIRRGEPMATNISYWGSNSCRAGWIAGSAKDLHPSAQDYVESFAGPYLAAVGEWFDSLRIGTEGGNLWKLIQQYLPFEKYHIYLNPGHLIHLDEWVSSPIFRDSKIKLRSGMALQVDIIPSSDIYFSTRVEDGVVLADEHLRNQIKEQYPDCFSRCCRRREFMTRVLGIDLPPEVLPLSNITGIIPPFMLSPNKIISLTL